jgi:predicted metal-dependent peptidase
MAEEQIDRLKQQRIQLIRNYPFFGWLSMYLTLNRRDDVQTACVDKDANLYYSENYLATLTEDEIRMLIAHEISHVAFKSEARCRGRERQIWNYATDYKINQILDENGFSVNNKWLRDNKYNDMGAEEVYDDLIKHAVKVTIYVGKLGTGDIKYGQGKGKGIGKGDKNGKEKLNGNGVGFEDSGAIEPEKDIWKDRIAEAYHFSKSYGKSPAGLERFYEDLLFPNITWKQQLYKYICDNVKSDTTWSRPNRKFINQGIYLPSFKKENIELVLAVDTSGSIDEKMLSEFYNEIISIRDSFNNIKLTVLTCDTQVHEAIEIENHEKPDIKMKGGGGTNFIPVFDWICEHKPMIKILVYLTDLCGTFPKDEYSFATIWATKKEWENTNIPFGEKIVIG